MEPSDKVNCDPSRQKCLFDDDIQEIKSDVKEVKKILNGNGKAGLVAQVLSHDEHIRESKKRNWDLGTFIFRAFLAVLVTYIAINATP